tara:strand:- start:649 stop:795 length:147 start_codon:yes stop_codon:yes gene_type:complete
MDSERNLQRTFDLMCQLVAKFSIKKKFLSGHFAGSCNLPNFFGQNSSK